MSVKGTIEHLLDNMEEEAVIESERRVTFSIRMRESEHEMLEYLANYFGMKKTPFADMLLRDALLETMQTIAYRRAGGDKEKAREVYFEMLSEMHPSVKEAAS